VHDRRSRSPESCKVDDGDGDDALAVSWPVRTSTVLERFGITPEKVRSERSVGAE